MTTSDLIQILCKMDPSTEVLISIDGWPSKHKVALSRVYDANDRPTDPKQVLLTTDAVNLKKTRRR